MFIRYCIYVFLPLKERISLITFNDGSVIAVNVIIFDSPCSKRDTLAISLTRCLQGVLNTVHILQLL